MIDDGIIEGRRLHEIATPAPWFPVANDLVGGTAIANREAPCSQLDIRSTDIEIADFMGSADAALIVHLRNHAPAWLVYFAGWWK